jgi:hypothetical protein
MSGTVSLKQPRPDNINASSDSDSDSDHAVCDAMPMLLAKYHLVSRFHEDLERADERHKRRRVALLRVAANVVSCCACVLQDYVRYRGGLNELRTFVPVSKEFDPRTFDDKMFTSYFRFEREEVQEIIELLKGNREALKYRGFIINNTRSQIR